MTAKATATSLSARVIAARESEHQDHVDITVDVHDGEHQCEFTFAVPRDRARRYGVGTVGAMSFKANRGA